MINLDFFRRRERFLVLEIAKDKTSALLLSIDDERNLRLEKIWDEFSLKKLSAAQARNLRKKKIIVSAAPELIYTTTFPVKLVRDSPARPLTLIELENLLAQTIGKLFNGERKNAGAHLGADELDAILVNSKITDFRVDGHAVFSPVGFGGKTVEGVLELAFTTRPVFYGLKDLFNSKEGFFFTGAHLAGLRSLAWAESLPANLLFVGEDNTFYLTLDKAAWGNAIYSGEIEWRMKLLWKAVISALQTSRSVVMGLYDAFIKKDASPAFVRSFYRILQPEVNDFLAQIKKSRLRGRVFLYSPVPVPFDVPRAFGRITFLDLPLAKALAKGGFRADLGRWPLAPQDAFMKLAPFFEFYYDRSGSDINNKLRRRLHWLIQE